MRGRSLTDLLIYEAKRRPKVRELYERAEHLTDEEIASADVPMRWYRDALRQVRDARRAQAVVEVTTEEIAAFIVDGTVPDPEGEVLEWHGDDEFVGVDRGELRMRYRALILRLDDGVLYDTLFSRKIDPKVLARCVSLGRATKSAYKTMVRDAANRNCPVDAPVINVGAPDTAAARLSALGVRFR